MPMSNSESTLSSEQRGPKPYPWKCGRCRKRAVNPAVREYSTEAEHDGRAYVVTVRDLVVSRCDNCGAIVLDDDANRRISDALRGQIGVLTPAEIRANREKLDLTQKQLASVLGIAESTLSRWETGAQIQQRALDKLLRLYFGSGQVREMLAGVQQRSLLGAETGTGAPA
ncbi:MAG: type II toxin-antitoxin system MqsA family antitoxin [Planctomycetia bacterium]|nr:type II toxin-antitoxin system MqsA family antitoxin [Planctomycetia bacterium]